MNPNIPRRMSAIIFRLRMSAILRGKPPAPWRRPRQAGLNRLLSMIHTLATWTIMLGVLAVLTAMVIYSMRLLTS